MIDTNPPIACRISFWSVPAIVFRLFPLGLRGRDLLFTVSWVSGPDSKDFLLIDILAKPRPLTSTATISAGNLRWKRTFRDHNKGSSSICHGSQNWMGRGKNISNYKKETDFWLIQTYYICIWTIQRYLKDIYKISRTLVLWISYE